MSDGKTYLVKDLVGCEVVTVKGEALGALRDVLPTRGNDVFVVGEGKAEVMIPALKTVVLEVDLEKRRILVDLPEGILDPLGKKKRDESAPQP